MADKPTKLNLYGCWVPAEKYEKIKRLADILVGETIVAEPRSQARKRAVKVAVTALIQMNPNAGWFLDLF